MLAQINIRVSDEDRESWFPFPLRADIRGLSFDEGAARSPAPAGRQYDKRALKVSVMVWVVVV